MNRVAIFMAVPLLMGCSMHSKNPANGDENVSINADESGHISFNLPIGQGELKVPTGFMHKGDFDIDGVKLPPGSSITGVSVFARNEGSTVNMSFNAPTSPDDVRSYFVEQFRRQGVAASLSGDEVAGKTKDGSPFRIDVGPASNGSKGKIEVQSKD